MSWFATFATVLALFWLNAFGFYLDEAPALGIVAAVMTSALSFVRRAPPRDSRVAGRLRAPLSSVLESGERLEHPR